MPSLRHQLRDYFDAHRLPAERVDAILAAARAPAAAEPERKIIVWPRMVRMLALAATVAIFAGVASWVRPSRRAPVPFAALAPRVVEFFGGTPHLPLISQDQAALHSWLLAQGAPPAFTVPASLRPLESFACSVVDVQGRPAYLTCFWRKKNTDGTGGELIHLLAVRREDFRGQPPGREPQTREIGDWSFASWTDGDVTYTLAAAAPLDKVRAFLVQRAAWKLPLIAALALSAAFS